MSQNRIPQERDGIPPERDAVFDGVVNRMCNAGWIDVIIERTGDEVPPRFHFTALGKKRFREIDQIMRELGNDRDLMSAPERSETLAIVEAWIQDVEEQAD